MRVFIYNSKHFVDKKSSASTGFSHFHQSYKRKAKDFKEMPGPLSLPLIGTLYQYLPLIGQYSFDKLHSNQLGKFIKYGPIVREEILPGENIVWLFDPDDVKTLFRNEGKYPFRRSHLALQKYRLDKPNVYNSGGLLPTNGEEWGKLRKVFQKGISSLSDAINFISDTDDIVQEFLDIIQKNDLEKFGADKDFLPLLSRLFLEITCQMVLDFRLRSFSTYELRDYSDSSVLIWSAFTTNSCIFRLDNTPPLWKYIDTPLYRKLKSAQQAMENFAIDRVQLKISTYEDNIRQRKTLLERYLASNELDLKDIIGIVCDLLLAGIDTTTYSSAFMFYHLAKNPEVQEKLYKEALQLLPSEKTPLTRDLLVEAKYTRAVVKESLRLNPISIGVGRILDRDLELGGYNVPKGTNIVTQSQITSRLQEYVDRPNVFLPERWIRGDPAFKQYHPFVVLPFGHGSRTCIAKKIAEQNMQILALKSARMFKILWIGGKLDTKSYLVNKPDGPVALKFTRR